MICPSCGAEVAASKFCENCGSPLAAAQDQTVPIAQATEPMQPHVAEVPGDSAWEAQPQQAYQASQTVQMPAQGQADGGYVPPSAESQTFYQQPSYQMPKVNQAPSAAFVLVIVGLILSVLFVTFIPGLVCSIIGLVLNSGYNKKGLDNPRKTSTMVVGIIGIVVAVLCAAFSIFIGVVTAQVINEAEQQGIDIANDSIEVTTDSSGHINITVNDSSSSAAASESSTAASSTSASSSTSSSASASSASAASSVYFEGKYHDGEYNPTLYSLLELSGADLSDLLDTYNFMWDDEYEGWAASDGSLFAVVNASGELGNAQIKALPTGAVGQPVVLYLCVEGYSTPTKALSGLAKDIVVEKTYGDDETYFAVVYGSPMARYLVTIVPTDDDEQTFLLFTEEAVSSGLFNDLLDVKAGTSIDEVWKAIEG